jgi:DNA-binding beta-propeller fold protein YncE
LLHALRYPFELLANRRLLTGSVLASAGLAGSLLALAGCGTNYRPVVTSINPVGPAGQPTRYVTAVSSNGPNSNGLFNLIDFSGDTIVNTTTIGINPQYVILGASGSQAYVINGDGTLNEFPAAANLIGSQINSTTLPANSGPISLFPQGSYDYVAEAGLNQIGLLSGSSTPAFQENLPTGTAGGANGANTATVYTVGIAGATRIYTLVKSLLAGVNGFVAAIETSTNTISTTLPVGVNPVYGVMTSDGRRAFILNQGSNNVTVVNAQTNLLDSFQTVAGGPASSTIPVGTAPVWADFAPTLNEMLVVNNGNPATNTPGSVSIISIPLCTSNVVSNPNCSTSNPIDAVGFGSVLATVPVGINPVQVTVLADGSQAYVANEGILPSASNPAGTPGSISVINLTTNQVTATIQAGNSTNELDSIVHGHPFYIASILSTPTGKVYVVSPDSTDITILRTDTDQVLTHLTLQGNGVSVRVSANQ